MLKLKGLLVTYQNRKENFLKSSQQRDVITLGKPELEFLDMLNETAQELSNVLEIGDDPELWGALAELTGSRASALRMD